MKQLLLAILIALGVGHADSQEEKKLLAHVLATVIVWDGTVAELGYIDGIGCVMRITLPEGGTHHKQVACPNPVDFFGVRKQAEPKAEPQAHRPREYQI